MLAKSVLVIFYESCSMGSCWVDTTPQQDTFAPHFSMQQASLISVTQNLVPCSSGPLPVTKAHSTQDTTTHVEPVFTSCSSMLASFPGPAQLSVASSMEKRERAWNNLSHE